MIRNERILTIGRRPDCDIVLTDDTVSGRHAEITVLDGGQVLIKDCDSANGTSLFADGTEVPIQEKVVSSWEVLRFGDYEIEVSKLLNMIPEEPPPPPPPPPLPLPERRIRESLDLARHKPELFEMEPELASRGGRLAAVIFDTLLAMPLWVMVVVGTTMELRTPVIVGVLLALLLLAIQFVLLVKDGQTIGKKLTGVRIVKVNSGQNGGFVTNFVLRVLPIGLVPPLGLIDPFFIFREDRRCLHDLIAGTKVVNVDA